MNRILTNLLLIPLAATAFYAFAADAPESGTNSINGLVRFTNADAGILARLGPAVTGLICGSGTNRTGTTRFDQVLLD